MGADEHPRSDGDPRDAGIAEVPAGAAVVGEHHDPQRDRRVVPDVDQPREVGVEVGAAADEDVRAEPQSGRLQSFEVRMTPEPPDHPAHPGPKPQAGWDGADQAASGSQAGGHEGPA